MAKIYFDNALLTFDGYTSSKNGGLGPWAAATGRVPPAWRDDPRMPVNRAGEIAKAGIKVLLVYGTSDIAVKPSANSAAFAAKFKAAGGDTKALPHAGTTRTGSRAERRTSSSASSPIDEIVCYVRRV